MRAEINRAGARSRSARWLERAALRGVIGSRRVMRSGAAALRLYERSGLQRLLRGRRLLGPLARAEALLPPASEPHRPPILIPARSPRRGRVAFFAGCVMPELFGSANEATVRVLAHNGFEVHVPSEQGCCGALNRHSGDPAGAERLHKRNRRAFSLESVDAVIVNAAGCGAALRDTGDELGNKVRDVSEWLVECGLVAPTRAVPRRVGYDDPCHLLHGQRVSEAPRRLLRAIPELELVELPGSSDCCGAAGTYNLTHPEMAERLLERKVAAVRSTGIDTLTTGNPGCLMQLGAGLRRAGLAVEVRHPVELLAEAYAD
jgi:glycolate oxidase iron-sulfur subunit